MEEQVPLKPAPSLATMLTDVFTSPGDSFTALKGTASAPSLWAVPLIVSVIIAALFTYTIFTNDALRSQMAETQRQAIEKAVNEGRMTREQADMTMDRMESGGTGIVMAIGMVVAVIFVALSYFVAALFLWLAAKTILKTTEGYSKYLELYGSAGWIGILGAIVTLLMMIGMGSMYAQPGGSLLIMSSFDPNNTMHKLLAAINIFGLWQTAVVGIGLARFSGKSTGMGLGVAYGLWVIWVLVEVFLGLAR